MENFNIIQALCRCALADNPSNATIQQIKRLRDVLFYQDSEQSQKIAELLSPQSHDTVGKLVQSERGMIVFDGFKEVIPEEFTLRTRATMMLGVLGEKKIRNEDWDDINL